MFRVIRPSVSPVALLFLPLLAVLALGSVDLAHAQTVTLVLSSTSIDEDGGVATVTATVSPASTTPFTVEISAVASTPPRVGLERIAMSGTTLSFAANATASSGTVTIAAQDNAGHTEGGVTVTVSGTVSGGTGVTGPADRMLTIAEDDGIGSGGDTIRPTVEVAGSTVVGARAVLDFSEQLRTDRKPSKTQFLLRVNQRTDERAESFEVMGDKVILTLVEPVESHDVLRILYTPPKDDNLDIDLSGALQDPAGNPVYRTGYVTLTNNTNPRVNLVLTPSLIAEDGGESTVTATVAKPSSAPFTVTVAVTPAAPATTDDFTVGGNTVLNFAAGDTQSTGVVTITAVDNDEEEGHAALAVSGTLAGTTELLAPFDRTLTIRDDELPDVGREALVQQAWLARFGRIAAGHVLDNVRDRLTARRGAGLRARLAGQTFGGAGRDLYAPDMALHPFRSRPVPERDLLAGSAVALTGASGDRGSFAVWGRGGYSGFEGRDGAVRLDGEVATASLGADYATRGWLLGLALSHSWGEGEFREDDYAGTIETSLTGAYPYVGFAVTERLSLWGVAGYGQGTLTAKPASQLVREADMSLAMGGGGVRGVLLPRKGPDGLELSLASEAVFASTNSEGAPGLKGADAQTSLLRVGLEGSWGQAFDGGATLTPSFVVGVRRDGGDAETGFGVDVGGGIAWAGHGLLLELKARALVTHEAAGLREWGVSGSLRLDPAPGSARGASLTVTPSWGADAPRPSGTAARPRTARLGAEFAYGFPALAGRFTGTPYLGIGLTRGGRQIRAGWRLAAASRGAADVTVRLEAAQFDRAGAAPEHVTGLRFVLRR